MLKITKRPPLTAENNIYLSARSLIPSVTRSVKAAPINTACKHCDTLKWTEHQTTEREPPCLSSSDVLLHLTHGSLTGRWTDFTMGIHKFT